MTFSDLLHIILQSNVTMTFNARRVFKIRHVFMNCYRRVRHPGTGAEIREQRLTK